MECDIQSTVHREVFL